MPLFEAVVNSIHSIEEGGTKPKDGCITIDIQRSPQMSLSDLGGKPKRGVSPTEPIIGFTITDNGAGFNNKNMQSFETLDSDAKAHLGCRGVGRLIWLKAFNRISISSTFRDGDSVKKRSFVFTVSDGISAVTTTELSGEHALETSVHLEGFIKDYQEIAPKTVTTIGNSLFEHCLWYFVRDGGAPTIRIIDDGIVLSLESIYAQYMYSSSKKETITLKNQTFELTHLKLQATTSKAHYIALCAGSRVVEEDVITGKITGLFGKIKDESGEFIYACYVTSPYLDDHARSERIGFDLRDSDDGLFADTSVSKSEIKTAVLDAAATYLEEYLKENKTSGLARVDNFVSKKAPRYRPILARISEDKLAVDPEISDKDLDLLLHKQLSEIEGSLIAEGHEIMHFGKTESHDDYRARLSKYLSKVDDIKKSDLANYVFHRKVVLDILTKALDIGEDGKYAREELIHDLIMPMKKTSDEILCDGANLWLLDERLAFHNYLASDKTLASMPITGAQSTKEPDIVALNFYDSPILVNDGGRMPLAALTVVEIKRPMRNDAAQGEDKDPIEQALGYLKKIREGKVTTATGRPIPSAEKAPGFCYIICDLTPTIVSRCEMHDFTRTGDGLGYFGYKSTYNAYVEVISFNGLLNSANERNRAFFDKLGLPSS